MLLLCIIIIIALIIIILLQKKQLNYYSLVSKNLSAMKVIQNMYDIIGTNLDAKSKLEELNKNIITTYDIKYSSLVVYDGDEYKIYSSNVDEEYYNGIIEIVKESNIKNNIKNNVSKYITTSSDKTLLYKSAVERNIKSCMFIPIYNKDVYLGFLLLEDEIENAFDSMSKSEISKLKNNLGVFLDNTLSQGIIEKTENIDRLTNVYNNIYLYTNVRNKLLKYENSSIALFDFYNMKQINELYSRELTNSLLIKSIDNMKDIISNDSEIIRYSGTKFLIIIYGTIAENSYSVVERILDRIKNNAVEKIENKYINLDTKILLTTIKKQSNVEMEIQNMIKNMEKFKENEKIKII